MMNKPFSNDKLQRKQIAENFKNIILNTDLNVISVSAPWGGGKTYFIQNLIKLIKNDSINILYNAWESDFYESPIIPIFVELFNEIEKTEIKSELDADIKWSKKFAEQICKKSSFQVGLNFKVVNCAVNFDQNKEMIDSEYIELKKNMQEFKSKLKSIQEKLNKKIIIFIDELDRCHPMYTIKTLEIIKHFFGIPNIVFVLSVDKKQIENSVRQIFGVNIGEENGYLRKFIDVDFQLPTPSMEQLAYYYLIQIWDKINKFIDTDRYCSYDPQLYVDSHGITRGIATNNEQIHLSRLISKIAKILNFSVRDLEKFYARLNLTLDVLSNQDILFIEQVLALNALAMHNLEFFNDYISKNALEASKKLTSIFPTWMDLFSLFIDNIENINKHSSMKPSDIYPKIFEIHKHLLGLGINNIKDQKIYLQNYPEKIKFINNFNIME